MKISLVALCSCLFLATTALADPPAPPTEASHTLAVELVDAGGRAVEGAEVGLSTGVGGPYRKLAAAAGTEWHYSRPHRHCGEGANHSPLVGANR